MEGTKQGGMADPSCNVSFWGKAWWMIIVCTFRLVEALGAHLYVAT